MNQSVLTGYMCNSATLYQGEDGTLSTEFTLAVRRKTGKDTDYIICVAEGWLAETVVARTRKGDKLGVVGRIETPSWTDDDGAKRFRIYVKVNEVDLPPIKKEDKLYVQEMMSEV